MAFLFTEKMISLQVFLPIVFAIATFSAAVHVAASQANGVPSRHENELYVSGEKAYGHVAEKDAIQLEDGGHVAAQYHWSSAVTEASRRLLRGARRLFVPCPLYVYRWQRGDTCQSVMAKFCGMRSGTNWRACLGVNSGFCYGISATWSLNTMICVNKCIAVNKAWVPGCDIATKKP